MKQVTNLKKNLSPVNVWALALGSIIGWGAFVIPGNTILVNAGPLGTLFAIVALIYLAFAGCSRVSKNQLFKTYEYFAMNAYFVFYLLRKI